MCILGIIILFLFYYYSKLFNVFQCITKCIDECFPLEIIWTLALAKNKSSVRISEQKKQRIFAICSFHVSPSGSSGLTLFRNEYGDNFRSVYKIRYYIHMHSNSLCFLRCLCLCVCSTLWTKYIIYKINYR